MKPRVFWDDALPVWVVAFTPKGGCPLKLAVGFGVHLVMHARSSIHPQGWVPIETIGAD